MVRNLIDLNRFEKFAEVVAEELKSGCEECDVGGEHRQLQRHSQCLRLVCLTPCVSLSGALTSRLTPTTVRYQTTSHVILNIMIKNLKESDVKVKLIDETLDVTCNLADGSEFKLHFNLFKSIYVSESNWTVSPSKLEVKLKKTDRKRWQSLEVLPDKSGKRPLSFVGFVQQNATKKANTAITRVNTSLVDDSMAAPFSPRYDWYQTGPNVIISIQIPNLTENDVKVEFTENTLMWSCTVGEATYNVKLNLFKPIVVEQCTWKLTVSKLEIVLRKRDSSRWSNLEAVHQTIKSTNDGPMSAIGGNWTQVKTTFIREASPEPSSSGIDSNTEAMVDNNGSLSGGDSGVSEVANNNKTFNYTLVSLEPTDILVDDNSSVDIKNDKVLQNLYKNVTEFKEREEKDGAVDDIFREIYEKGGEEVRRAVNKKFSSSGGQTLEENRDVKNEEENDLSNHNEEQTADGNDQTDGTDRTDATDEVKTQIDLADEVCAQSSDHTIEEPNV